MRFICKNPIVLGNQLRVRTQPMTPQVDILQGSVDYSTKSGISRSAKNHILRHMSQGSLSCFISPRKKLERGASSREASLLQSRQRRSTRRTLFRDQPHSAKALSSTQQPSHGTQPIFSHWTSRGVVTDTLRPTERISICTSVSPDTVSYLEGAAHHGDGVGQGSHPGVIVEPDCHVHDISN